MEFVKVLETSSLPAGAMTHVAVNGKNILIANVAGTYYAMDNKCTHLGGSLSKGKLEGTVVACPNHGASFELTTGQPCTNAKIAFLTMKVKPERCYSVKVQEDSVMIGVD
jgi:3-phenylpropionate/trans-cinnamate dioxygenase ferredoxin component